MLLEPPVDAGDAVVAATWDASGSAASADQLPIVESLQKRGRGAMFVRDRDGRFLLASDDFADIIGAAADDVVGRTVSEVLPAPFAEEQWARDLAVWRTGEPSAQVSTLVFGSDDAREFVTHRFPITDADGTVLAVGGHAFEVTELVAQRRNGHESETRFRTIFDVAPIGQILSDADGTVTAANPPMAAMLGYRPADMVGRSTRDFLADGEDARVIADIAGLAAGAVNAVTARRLFRHRLGHDVPVAVTSAALRDIDGDLHGWVSMVRDVSDEERARLTLEQAHRRSVRTAARLRVLHAASMAANEASGIDTIAPVVLRLLADYLESSAGALLQWPPETTEPAQVLHSVGATCSWTSVVRPVDCNVVVAAAAGPDTVSGQGMTVVVPLSGAESRLALVFRGTGRPDTEQLELLALVGSDVSRVVERETTRERLRRGELRFRSVFDSSPLPMALTLGDSGTFGAVNEALCTLVGRTREELIGRSARDLCHPDDVGLTDPAGAAALASPDGTHQVEIRLLHSSGAVVFADVTLTWMRGANGDLQLLAHMADVTGRRTAEALLRRQAEEDGLTGLANRARLARILAEHGRQGLTCTVLFIDLDGFKLINDTRGHDVGDEVLVAVAQRLRRAVRDDDLVARFGGDEFVVVCPTPADLGTNEYVVRVRAALAPVIATSGGTANVTASIGIAHGLVDEQCPQLLVERADAAMYEAKRLGKDRHAVCDEPMRRRAVNRKRTELILRNALDEGRVRVYYQPVVDLADDRIVGCEALVRLIDEDGALVSPGAFIEVAEQSGLIVPLGAWVLRESCARIAALRAETGRPLTVSVNVAARQAARPDFAASVVDALTTAGLPAGALALELTESALLAADESTLRQLKTLREAGVGISLDDFGTGYSSLTYLRHFPVSVLKVDRSFVAGMMFEPSDRAIVRAVTGLAADLGLTWIAEGVETIEQHQALTVLGAGFAQGYLHGRPMPDTEFGAALAADVAVERSA
ncbi:EAL domain-containing protein [uncultured Jatrophihabitans sp.]|uniref:sensor domain-containing protein n=1 Tax=uncultured Jatrophihabitans sp. TaxID=1610747 RepID=UPI0035C9BA79